MNHERRNSVRLRTQSFWATLLEIFFSLHGACFYFLTGHFSVKIQGQFSTQITSSLEPYIEYEAHIAAYRQVDTSRVPPSAFPSSTNISIGIVMPGTGNSYPSQSPRPRNFFRYNLPVHFSLISTFLSPSSVTYVGIPVYGKGVARQGEARRSEITNASVLENKRN